MRTVHTVRHRHMEDDGGGEGDQGADAGGREMIRFSFRARSANTGANDIVQWARDEEFCVAFSASLWIMRKTRQTTACRMTRRLLILGFTLLAASAVPSSSFAQVSFREEVMAI